MNKFHQAVTKYRECTRHIRNAYFQPEDDCGDAWAFTEGWKVADLQLYFWMVIYPHGLQHIEQGLPNPSITLRIKGHATTAFINRNTSNLSTSWDHPTRILYADDCTLIFRQFFDFNELEPIDFKYVMVEIKDAKDSDLNGHFALIEWENLEFEINKSQQSGAGYPPQGVGSPDP